MEDITGRQISAANIIAYPHRHGSSLWMNLGMVVETGRSAVNEWSDGEDPFIRVLKIPQQEWSEEPGDQFKRKIRTSVLRNVGNVVVVAPDVHCLNLPEPIQSGAVKLFTQFWNQKRAASFNK